MIPAVLALALPLSTLATPAPLPTPAPLGGGERLDRLFIENARVDLRRREVSFPRFRGTSHGRTVYFIVTEASDGDVADMLGVPRVQKLENARGTAAVMHVRRTKSTGLDFPATVDFGPERVVVPDPVTGFPPLRAEPGSVGEEGYSPLVQLPDGTVLNAPHVANDSGLHDHLLAMDVDRGRVVWELVDGFSRDDAVVYVTTDASDPVAAALEGVTFAPLLAAAPSAGGDGTDSARASLSAVTNGRTGVDDPERQGLGSALMGEGAPLNILAWKPNQGRYSPLWDVHLTTFAPGVRPERILRFADVEDLAEKGDVTAPDGSRWGASGFIVNCPIVGELDD